MLKGSRVGLVSVLVVTLLLSSFPGTSTGVPTGEFASDFVEVPILANETVGLTDPSQAKWLPPIGWPGHEKLEHIIIYSDEGHAIKYGVDAIAIEGGRGIEIVSSSNHKIPQGLERMWPIRFQGDRFLAPAKDKLYELDLDDMGTRVEIDLGFEHRFYSNLWNRWSPLNSQGELLFAMANRTTIGLYAKIPPNPILGEFKERDFYVNVSLDDYHETSGSVIVGALIVLNVPLVENGSLLVVPTDQGIAALSIDIPVEDGRRVNVSIGEIVWYISYEDIADRTGNDVVPATYHPITTASGSPSEHRDKDRIYLLTKNGFLHSVFRANGTLGWTTDLVGDVPDRFEMFGIWPNLLGPMMVTARVGDDGFIAAVDPKTGQILGNGTYYHFTPSHINMDPLFIYSSRNYLFNDGLETVYILDQSLGLGVQFKVPGGLASNVGYVGNIVNNIGSSQGNYFAAVTKNATLRIQSFNGQYTPPPFPQVDPDDGYAVIVTNKGNVTIDFFTPDVDRTLLKFNDLVTNGFYNDTPIQLTYTEYSIQTDVSGDHGSYLPPEGSALAISHHYAAVSMATHGPDKAGPVFMIVTAEWGDREFDGEHGVFGMVTGGMDVVLAIQNDLVDQDGDPIDAPIILEIVLIGPREAIPPIVHPGEDRSIRSGEMVQLNGSASTDNVGIVNWTWSFVYDGEEQRLYGPMAEFTFEKAGNYTIDLTLRDEAGNTATGNLTVLVEPWPLYSEGDEEGWLTSNVAYILILVIAIVVAVILLFEYRKRYQEG